MCHPRRRPREEPEFMPSPFPGMDPFLEDPGLWPDVHHELISVARELLGGSIRPKYHVRIEERVYVLTRTIPVGRSSSRI
jgi:hypothetical protein